MASEIALALAAMPEVCDALLAAHVRASDGCCAKCRWQTRAADRWPCTVYSIAAAARAIAAEERPGADPG